MRSRSSRGITTTVHLLANQGEIGGGEVMLHHLATAFRELNWTVHIVAPATPSEVADRLSADGFDVTRIPGRGRRAYALGLRRWGRARHEGLLWCNGLLPALALAGFGHRIVHLHQVPPSNGQRVATRIARCGALATVVPSHFVARQLPGTVVLENWVGSPDPDFRAAESPSDDGEALRSDGQTTIGFLGRLSEDKGVMVLLEAMQLLQTTSDHLQQPYRLAVAGEARFVDDDQAQQLDAALSGRDDVVLLGWQQTFAFLRRIDVLVCPSLVLESFGLVAAEAMAAGVPVVVSDSGALPEVVGRNHPLISQSGDADGLADVIRQATSMSKPERAKLSDAQYQRWLSLWSPDAGRNRLRQFLLTLNGSLQRPLDNRMEEGGRR